MKNDYNGASEPVEGFHALMIEFLPQPGNRVFGARARSLNLALSIPIGFFAGIILGAALGAVEGILDRQDVSGMSGGFAFMGAVIIPICYGLFLLRFPIRSIAFPIAIGTLVGGIAGTVVSDLTGWLGLNCIVLGVFLGCAATSSALALRYE